MRRFSHAPRTPCQPCFPLLPSPWSCFWLPVASSVVYQHPHFVSGVPISPLFAANSPLHSLWAPFTTRASGDGTRRHEVRRALQADTGGEPPTLPLDVPLETRPLAVRTQRHRSQCRCQLANGRQSSPHALCSSLFSSCSVSADRRRYFFKHGPSIPHAIKKKATE